MGGEFIHNIREALEQGSLLIFFLVFWGAAILSVTSCAIIRLPVVIGFVGGVSDSKKKAFLLTLCFVCGMTLSFTLLGVLLGLMGGLAAAMVKFSRYFYYIIGAAAVFIGIRLAGLADFGHLDDIVCRKISSFMPAPVQGGLMGAFLFGLIFALFEAPTCPACGPILFFIAGLTVLKGKIIYGILLFFTYALGQGLPILLLGGLTGMLKYIHPKTEKIEAAAGLVGGNVLLLMGLYLFLLG